MTALTIHDSLAVVRVGDWRLGLPMRYVERVLSAALPAALPAPDGAHAVMRVEGALVPVVYAAALLGIPEVSLEPDDKVVLLRAGERPLLLWVDVVEDIVPFVPLPEQAKDEVARSSTGWLLGLSGGEHTLPVLDVEAIIAACQPHEEAKAPPSARGDAQRRGKGVGRESDRTGSRL